MRTALIATRATRTDDRAAEAEPVVVDVFGDTVRLELDDGELLDLDRVELQAALQAAA